MKSEISIRVAGASLLICLLTLKTSAEDKTGNNAQINKAQFEVASVKPVDLNKKSGSRMGVYTYPGGKIFVGYSTLNNLIAYAFDVQLFQVLGGPDWAGSMKYDVEGVPPVDSKSSKAAFPFISSPLTAEQQIMLQNLLIDRFNLRLHREMRAEPVYILERNTRACFINTFAV